MFWNTKLPDDELADKIRKYDGVFYTQTYEIGIHAGGEVHKKKFAFDVSDGERLDIVKLPQLLFSMLGDVSFIQVSSTLVYHVSKIDKIELLSAKSFQRDKDANVIVGVTLI